MALERRKERRLTNEERDRVLDIAARLQAQHQSTMAVGDLAQAAAEAGIDERFVHEAIERLDARSVPDIAYRVPLVLFVFQACAFILQKDITVSGGDRPLILHEAIVAAIIALVLSLWASRSRAIRMYVPILSAVVWTLVGIVASFYMNQHFLIGFWVPGFAALYGFIQTFAALAGVVASRLLDRPLPGGKGG